MELNQNCLSYFYGLGRVARNCISKYISVLHYNSTNQMYSRRKGQVRYDILVIYVKKNKYIFIII